MNETFKMQQQKENLFLEKFRLLSSQEYTEEINWSSSCSSDYEHLTNDKSITAVHKTRRKRKRKNKVPKNISNLSIKILDTSRESKKLFCEEQSPILSTRKSASVSPILQPSQRVNKCSSVSSPILSTKLAFLKSPILGPKKESPKSVVRVRKKLFDSGNINNVNINTNEEENTRPKEYLLKEEDSRDNKRISCQSIKFADINDDSLNVNTSTAKLELVKRVKSFFDSHFSSENTSLASQNSISEVLTPKNSTKTSDEIEMFTCKTQNISENNSINSVKSLKQNYSGNSSESSLYEFSKNSKKVKYKKDGHAYRLNNLLKKQNASLSLWQHEKFLAANSNFILPKGEFKIFGILKFSIKYGCHLLETVDAEDNNFLIVINGCYVSDNIETDTVLKLYAPYKIIQYDDKSRLIINVTKFECSHYKSE